MSTPVEKAALDKFGKWLVRDVRDYAIADADRFFQEPAQTAKYPHWLHEKLTSELDDEQRKLIRYLIPQIVDATIHNLLWGLGQVNEIDVKVKVDSESALILRDVGDALRGAMFEWIRDYSEQRFDYLDDADALLPEI